MHFSSTEEMIKHYRALYAGISSVFSAAIDEEIHFNISGFKHLIYKGKHRRKADAIRGRLILIPLIVPVIRNCSEEKEIRIRREVIDGKRVRVTYYALEAHVGKEEVRVRVVTRKIGDRGKHFFYSVMKY
jgi:hypothetical protein